MRHPVQKSRKFVFIDDDDIMRKIWRFAADEVGGDITTYASFDLFLSEISHYDKNTIIYIDSDLGPGMKGEVYAKQLYDRGFTEIHLATGYSKEQFGLMPWIKTIVSKTPPF